jgi:hypothetical protein
MPIEVFVTTDDMKNYLGDMDDISSSEENLLQQMIDGVLDLFEAYTNRKFARDVFVEVHDGEYSDKLFPKNVPITEINSIHQSTDQTWDSTTVLAATDYVIAHNTYVQYMTQRTLQWPQSIRISYTAGYTTDTFPQDLKLALIEQVAYKFQQEYSGRKLGVQSMTAQDGIVTFQMQKLLPSVVLVLNRHRKMNLG